MFHIYLPDRSINSNCRELGRGHRCRVIRPHLHQRRVRRRHSALLRNVSDRHAQHCPGNQLNDGARRIDFSSVHCRSARAGPMVHSDHDLRGDGHHGRDAGAVAARNGTRAVGMKQVYEIRVYTND